MKPCKGAKPIHCLVIVSGFLLQFVLLNAQETLTLADQIRGTWVGEIDISGRKLPLIINIDESNGAYFGTLDSPEQGVFGTGIEEILPMEDSIYLGFHKQVANYKGEFNKGYTAIDGVWTQGGYKLPLKLIKTEEEFIQKRPQEPTKPFPYTEQDVIFKNLQDSIFLSGTVTIPFGEGPFPGVVLLSGSGPQNRDEEVFGHRPFLVLADFLTKHGFAVLRYDDRGVAKSEGDFEEASQTELKNDALAAYRFLVSGERVDDHKVGILGHSEGGLLAAQISSEENLAFIILLSTPAQQGHEILAAQNQIIMEKTGFSQRAIEARVKFIKKLYTILYEEPDNDDAIIRIDNYIRDSIPPNLLNKTNLQVIATSLMTAWAREFLNYSPADDLKRADEPVLAIFGGKDVQVPKENAMLMEQILTNNEFNEVMLFAELNHLLQNADTGMPNEYGLIQETIDPVVLKIINDWLQKILSSH